MSAKGSLGFEQRKPKGDSGSNTLKPSSRNTAFLPVTQITTGFPLSQQTLRTSAFTTASPVNKDSPQWHLKKSRQVVFTPVASTIGGVPGPGEADARRAEAFNVRVNAANTARNRPLPTQERSDDEGGFPVNGVPSLVATFTKGLPHNIITGLINDIEDFKLFVQGIDKPFENLIALIPLGPETPGDFVSGIAQADGGVDVRGWESQGAGSTFDLQGPDAQAVAMPPAPAALSVELHSEMAEVYWMALLRDISLSFLSDVGSPVVAGTPQHMYRPALGDVPTLINTAIASLNSQTFISDNIPGLTPAEQARKRPPFNLQTVFRGFTPGDDVGPYLSQFIIQGTAGLGGINDAADGIIQYGSTSIDQRVRVATPGRDYMTTWASFYDVQNAADVRTRETYEDNVPFRFISTARDLATWVHFDALYQAYLNACIYLLNIRAPFDSGLPFVESDDIDRQEGFAVWGSAHILSLVTEVATRALKAVRFQKFNIHRRLRPEAVGGILDRFVNAGQTGGVIESIAKPLRDALGQELIDMVVAENQFQNENFSDLGIPRTADFSIESTNDYALLPMAFPEGSPMHPSYGSGHATVAGACVTILKAWFDTDFVLPKTFVVNIDGSALVDVTDSSVPLTVGGELNKLASNISVGRNWAGVHYFTDYFESVKLGEEVALGILEEQAMQYTESFTMTIPLFDGTTRVISNS